MKKVSKTILFVVIVCIVIVNISYAAFRDVTPNVNEAAEKCASSGLFGPFVYKYGGDLFRPDDVVRREDIMLVLKEYVIIINKLLASNKGIMRSLGKLGAGVGRPAQQLDINEVIEQVKKEIEPLLIEVSATSGTEQEAIIYLKEEVKKLKSNIVQLKEKNKRLTEVSEAGVSWHEITGLKKKMEDFNMKIDELKANSSESAEEDLAAKFKNNQKKIDTRIDGIKNSFLKLEKAFIMHKNLVKTDADDKVSAENYSQLEQKVVALNKKVGAITDENRKEKIKLENEIKKTGEGFRSKEQDTDSAIKNISEKMKKLEQKFYAQIIPEKGREKSKVSSTEFMQINNNLNVLNSRIDDITDENRKEKEKLEKKINTSILSLEKEEKMTALEFKNIKNEMMELEKSINKNQMELVKKTENNWSGLEKEEKKTAIEFKNIKNEMMELEKSINKEQKELAEKTEKEEEKKFIELSKKIDLLGNKIAFSAKKSSGEREKIKIEIKNNRSGLEHYKKETDVEIKKITEQINKNMDLEFKSVKNNIKNIENMHNKYSKEIAGKLEAKVSSREVAMLKNKMAMLREDIEGIDKSAVKLKEEAYPVIEQEHPDMDWSRESLELEGKLLIEDFNTGANFNIGAWDKDPEDDTQTCKETYDYINKIGKTGFGIKLAYDVDSPRLAYNGLWIKLRKADFGEYKNLYLSVKGDESAGFTKEFKIELKNSKNETGKTMVSGITNMWKEKVIPFEKFKGISDFSEMMEFVVVFEDTTSIPKAGAVFIDNIYVGK